MSRPQPLSPQHSANEDDEAGLPRHVDSSRFADSPELMLWQTRAQSLSMPQADLNALQLKALQRRFDGLRDRVTILKRLADEQGLTEINSLDDAARLLFKHSVYKSYPLSLIEKNRFDKLTQWLSNLTTVDVSAIDATKVESIDDWLDLLDRDTGIRMVHSTGTSGKLSFLPRSGAERDFALRTFRLGFENGDKRGMNRTPVIVPAHRHMYNGYGAMLDAVSRLLFKGDESMIVTLFPGRLSADLMSFAGRFAAASAKGELGRDQISPLLINRRESFIKAQKEAPALRAEFFATLSERLRGRRIAMTANWSMLHDMTEEGAAKGLSGVFAADSLVLTAGGTKGKVLPPDHKETTKKFLGADVINEGFGMSEMTSLMPKCAAGRYHAMPWHILYLLNPETGEASPRQGTHTGRFGVIDLSPSSYWGGFLSGDEVTMSFDACACGNSGATVADRIRRFSEIEGGDDKINCAGAPEAHDKALGFLADLA